MKRVLIIGPGGAGKSTLARTLADIASLPLIHLDAMFWRAHWVATPRDEWHAAVAAMAREPEWVMDGSYGGSLDIRLARCDTVVLLDLAPWRCISRVVMRRLRHRGRVRDDMAPGCVERLDGAFLWWILLYRWRTLPRVMTRLREARAHEAQVHVLRTPADVERFVADARVACAAAMPKSD